MFLIFFVFVLQCVAIVDPLTLNHMDVSSKPEKIKMDALCELTAKIQQNPHPGNTGCFYVYMSVLCHLLPCETEQTSARNHLISHCASMFNLLCIVMQTHIFSYFWFCCGKVLEL